MTYCTQRDLIDRFKEQELIQLTDIDDSDAINEDKLNQAIADADGLIDGYLASQVQLPLSVVPLHIVRIACDLTRYYLYDDAVTDQVQKNYDSAVRYLERVADGKIDLGIDSAGNSPSGDAGVEMESPGRVFGRDDNGFI